ncbi:MAG TPA: glycosyltransferase family 1 protein [Thermoleophilaceae bacterium]|nr:glycosyltransferase family 1 protein [Thermoleophilaceae bacterium]
MRPQRLRIGVDARAAAEVPAGRGRYVRELVRALVELDTGADLVLYEREPWEVDGTRQRLVRTRDPFWAGHAGALAARECDVVYATNSFLMAAVAGRRSVAMVHDLFGLDGRFGAPPGGRLERATLPLAARRAAGFICNSEATRADLLRLRPELSARAAVVPLGVDERFRDAERSDVPERHGLTGDYVLAVGTIEPRKNLPRLVEAYEGLPVELRERHRLAIAGGSGWKDTETERLARTRNDIVMLGYVDDDELPGLYAGATVFAFPSLAEGFGLPVLEAMAAGTAVVTSDRSSLSEIAGDAAALVDPEDVASIRAALAGVLTDAATRTGLEQRGRARSAEFSWRRTAQETLDYLTSVTSTFAAGKSRERNVSS